MNGSANPCAFGTDRRAGSQPGARSEVLRSLACALALLGAAGGTASGQSAAWTAGGSIVLAPGDQVRVTVWRKPELSGEFLVSADGSLKHPIYQDVKVAGLTIVAAKERIRTFLLKFETAPQISLEPLLQVSVGGEVRQPNLYRLPPETDVAQAVAIAGGPSEFGRLDRVRLVRGGEEVLLDLTRATPAALQMPIASGDRIFVGRRGNFFRDVVGPFASIAGAIGSLAIIVFRL